MTGFGADSRGLWCTDSSPGTVARLARAGFDWVALDLQHGLYHRTELIEVARCFPFDAAELVVRVPSCDFAAIGWALDAGATSVIVPQIAAVAEAEQAVAATFYPPQGGRSRGELGLTWGRTGSPPAALNAQTTCAVMIESAEGLAAVEAIAAVPGLGQLFVGPHDLSLSLGTTVEALLDDDSPGSPLRRVVAAAADHGLSAGVYAGSPAVADRFRAHGFNCIAVATDLWLVAQGAAAALAKARG